MAITITYVEHPPEWQGEPGRLHTPVPRNAKEAGEAVEKLIASGNVEQIKIKITTADKP